MITRRITRFVLVLVMMTRALSAQDSSNAGASSRPAQAAIPDRILEALVSEALQKNGDVAASVARSGVR